MTIFDIGSSGKSAEVFFNKLKLAKVEKLIDIRLNNTSQLSGFTKKNDLKFFLKEILDVEYVHILDFSPTKEILDNFKKKKITWDQYEEEYINLLKQRKIKEKYKEYNFNNCCFLCSEETNENCHRRLLRDYLFSEEEKKISL